MVYHQFLNDFLDHVHGRPSYLFCCGGEGELEGLGGESGGEICQFQTEAPEEATEFARVEFFRVGEIYFHTAQPPV